MSTHANMVRMTVTSVASAGTGTITLNAASSGYRSFASAYGADATVDVLITEGTTWEVARNCAYTNSGTTLGRGTLESSSTGSAVAFTSAAVVSVVATAQFGNNVETAQQTYIRGLLVTKNSGGNTLDISAGACYDPSSGKVISYAGATAVSAGTLGASQWNQVYIYDNAGTATIQVVNNADAPSTTYAGAARQGGTTITNKRWIGAFRTNGSSNIVANAVVESPNGYKAYLALTRVLSAGVATTYTSVSFATVAPSYVTTALFNTPIVAASAGGSAMSLSLDGSVESMYLGYPALASGFWYQTIWHPISYSSGVPRIYYLMNSASNAGYLDVVGFEVLR